MSYDSMLEAIGIPVFSLLVIWILTPLKDTGTDVGKLDRILYLEICTYFKTFIIIPKNINGSIWEKNKQIGSTYTGSVLPFDTL